VLLSRVLICIGIMGLAAGTNLEVTRCRSGTQRPDCTAAFMALHLTPKSSAYLEVSEFLLVYSCFDSLTSYTMHRVPGSGLQIMILTETAFRKFLYSVDVGFYLNLKGLSG
jgi:hypothetical protein